MQEMQGTQVRSLGQEDSLEKEMATHPSIPPWRIPWTEESVGLQSMGSQRVRHDWATNTHTGFQPLLSLTENNHFLLLHSCSYLRAITGSLFFSSWDSVPMLKLKRSFRQKCEALLQGTTCFHFGACRVSDIIHFDQATFYLISDSTCFMVQVNFLLQNCINCQHYPISQLHIPSGNWSAYPLPLEYYI